VMSLVVGGVVALWMLASRETCCSAPGDRRKRGRQARYCCTKGQTNGSRDRSPTAFK
jgi:hypothetical protein